MSDAPNVRPTKKQRELLGFIEQFIQTNGYSPSYREIMSGLHYTSVATVALHVNNLIKRGHLRKRDRSARSLEVAKPTALAAAGAPTPPKPAQEKWLVGKVNSLFAELEQAEHVTHAHLEQLHILVRALGVLGIDTQAQQFAPRLNSLQERLNQ